jgi:GNAT superfamily N-acetyltransferase
MSTALKIRKVTKGNEGEVKSFADREWQAWTKEKGYDHKTRRYAFAAYAGDKVVGLVNLGIIGGCAHLGELIVGKDVRGRGIGKQLLRRAEGCARENGCHMVYLETHEKNAEALKLYRDSGYATISEMPNNRFHFTWYILSKELRR